MSAKDAVVRNFRITAAGIRNYLDGEDLEILNILVSGYFDFDEAQAKKHRPMYMADYIEYLD